MTREGNLAGRFASRTTAGVKPMNEDAVGYAEPDNDTLLSSKGIVCAVADGVSSAEAGREASHTCIETFLSDYFTTPDTWSVKHAGQKLLSALNLKLYGLGREIGDEAKGYITTLSIVILKSKTAYLFHIGDSRIYRLRNSELKQLTTDHSASISEEKSYLTRAMGMDNNLHIDFSTVELEPGDQFLLTSDGVHDFVPHEQLLQTLREHKNDPDAACGQLIAKAEQYHSDDNISCLIAQLDDLGLESMDDLNARLTQLPFPPELEPGLKIDGYEVLSEVYSSQRSQIYLVRDIETGHKLVMKTPSQNYNDDPSYIERFIMEEWVGSRIVHQNVVKIVKAKQGRRRFLYYLMEYVEGQTLEKWINAHPDPRPREIMPLVEQLFAGVQAFHDKETTHQDLKPGNIMITEKGQLKIVDFGSVFTPGVSEIFSPVEQEVALGTLDYADPHYRFGRNTGIRGDVFSLAVIVYELFTGGFLPFGKKIERCESLHDFESLEYIPSFVKRDIIPLWFDRALEKAINMEPEARYGTVAELLFDLKNPNPDFLQDEVPVTVTDKDTTLFWKLMSGVWFSLFLVLLLILASK
jgi:protein phosphatase